MPPSSMRVHKSTLLVLKLNRRDFLRLGSNCCYDKSAVSHAYLC